MTQELDQTRLEIIEKLRRNDESDSFLFSKCVNLSNIRGFKGQGIRLLSEALAVNATLETLLLEFNHLGDEDVEILSEALKQNKKLQTIDLAWNNKIGKEGVKALGEALKQNSTLEEIDLSSNNIGDEGVKSLSEALKRNNGVQKIRLEFNKIGDEGAKALSEMLKQNRTLQFIGLRNNTIGKEGIQSLIDTLKNWNGTVTRLALDENPGWSKGLLLGFWGGTEKEINKLEERNKREAGIVTPSAAAAVGHFFLWLFGVGDQSCSQGAQNLNQSGTKNGTENSVTRTGENSSTDFETPRRTVKAEKGKEGALDTQDGEDSQGSASEDANNRLQTVRFRKRN